ncbi:hypothetical protein [Trueperella pyogenes]|uniref:hypothetical protein n=1 Tax=Trueperella pyogenes TaxID=1661 RepID=UPI0011C0770E|nr:hypothetical protein [Trueperella pyogenes]MBB3024919.1 hypothetical protein [Trueperella pyogenes]
MVSQLSAHSQESVWFIRNGLPTMLSFALRGYQILSRLLPLASIGAIYALWQVLALWLLGRLKQTGVILERSEVNFTGQVSEAGIWPLIALVFSIPAATVITIVIMLAMRKRQASTRAVSTAIATAIYIFSPALSAIVNDSSTLATPLLSAIPTVIFRCVIAIATLLFFWLGGGIILAWAGRRALRQLDSLAILVAKALPLLIITLLFVFYSQEAWQIARSNSWSKINTLALILVGLTIGLVVISSRERVLDILDTPIDDERANQLLAETPFKLSDNAHPARLTRLQRGNLILNLALTHLIQVFWFMILVIAFLLLLSVVSVPDPLAQAWLGEARNHIHLFGIQWAFGEDDIKVALILASFAGLSFAASTTTEQTYAKDFIAPLLEEIQLTKLAVQAHQVEVEQAGQLSRIFSDSKELLDSVSHNE